MRHAMPCVCLAIITAFLLQSPAPLAGQGTAGLSVANYQLMNEERLSRETSKFTYRADLLNAGPPLFSVTATLTGLIPGVRLPAGESAALHFAPVPANSQTTSSNTFAVLVDRTLPSDFTKLVWTFQPVPVAPVANAGPDQSAVVGKTVTLDGSKSTNPSGIGTLTYSWTFKTRPAGSGATLVNPQSVFPAFIPDVPGTFVITLTVSNGAASSSADTAVSTTVPPKPVANAGPDQTVNAGATAVLDGSRSTGSSGKPLTFTWTLQGPAGSAAALAGANTVSPTFVADLPDKTWVATLKVNDGFSDSDPSQVRISTRIVAPVANAGLNQTVNVNATVQLDGSASTDANGLPITYRWTFNVMPSGCGAALSDAVAVKPSFVAACPGTYVLQLIVNNGTLDSAPSTVTVTTGQVLAPVASAGPSQTVPFGAVVQLSGSGTDPQQLPVSFLWSLIARPAGSSASLSSTTVSNPTFVADRTGDFVAQLVVNNGYVSSAPSTVKISTTCTQPAANAGPAQTVITGATVTLDGSGSSDPCHDTLTYAWTLLSAPAGSAAALSGATTVSPAFVADKDGTYVAQFIVNNGFQASNPSTVTITAVPRTVIGLSPGTLSVATNGTGTLTITLSAAAGPGGQAISLSSSNPGTATVPPNVSVPAGQTTASVTVTPVAAGSATITASASGLISGTAIVTVFVPAITLALDSPTLAITQTIHGTIALSAPAPNGGAAITLAVSPPGIVDVQPAAVSIAGGASTGAFTVKGLSAGSASITASSPGYTGGTVSVTVQPLGSIGLPSSLNLQLGQSAALAVTLPAPAPADVVVTLASSDASKVTLPATVTIAKGSTTPSTPPQAKGVNLGSATITASAPGYSPPSTTTVNVSTSMSFSGSPLTVYKFGSGNLTLNLAASTPTDLMVNLTSSDPAIATVPSTVTIAANTNSVPVTVTAVAVGGPLTITATAPFAGSATATATVAVGPYDGTWAGTPKPEKSPDLSFAVSGNALIVVAHQAGGTFCPTGGFVFAPIVGNQFSGSGLTTRGSFSISGTFDSPLTVHGKYSDNCWGEVLWTGFKVTFTLAFGPDLTLDAGSTGNLTLNIVGPPPGVSFTVDLISSSTAVATVPASVTFPANATSVTIPVTGIAGGKVSISTSAFGIGSAKGNVTVNPGKINLPAALAVTVGQTTTLPVTLSAPAPSALTVTLTSSDNSKATVTPSSVTIAQGATTPATQPQVKGVAAGAATINATAAGYSPPSSPTTVTVSAGTGVLFQDNFATPGTRLDLAKWSTETGCTSFFGRTQLADWVTPGGVGQFVVGANGAELALNTYNPTGSSLYGTHAKTLQSFQPTANTAVTLTARLKLTSLQKGIVYGIYFYAPPASPCSGSNTNHDEIDIELVTNLLQPGSTPRVQLNRYAGEPLGAGNGELVDLPGGFDPLAFHDWTIRWTPSRVDYLVDNTLLKSYTTHVPQGPMQANAVAWGPAADWAAAYDASLQPAGSQPQNQRFVGLLTGVTVAASDNYDGDWAGTTSQGQSITFAVESNSVGTFSIGFTTPGGSCPSKVILYTGRPISGNQFSGSGSLGLGTSYTLAGTFDSLVSGKGNFTLSGSCSGQVSWTVSKK